MTKTGREWFETLSEVEQKQYRNNCIIFKAMMEKEDTFGGFISMSFYWIDSPEGHVYWENISNRKP